MALECLRAGIARLDMKVRAAGYSAEHFSDQKQHCYLFYYTFYGYWYENTTRQCDEVRTLARVC